MKKSLFLILLVISSLICSAQLQVKEGSFKKVEGFVNINTEKMFDDNDRPYAVLKIKTENINDKQRRELSFGGDAQTFFETEYKDGEVWLYISYYATFLKISHPDLSSTEFWFPFDMEPKRGYEMTLVNKPAIDEEIISRIEKLENASTTANQQTKPSSPKVKKRLGIDRRSPSKLTANGKPLEEYEAINLLGEEDYDIFRSAYRRKKTANIIFPIAYPVVCIYGCAFLFIDSGAKIITPIIIVGGTGTILYFHIRANKRNNKKMENIINGYNNGTKKDISLAVVPAPNGIGVVLTF